MSIGQDLKRQREKRDLDLDQVAGATKIPRHHLEALERGDLEKLPGPIFNRGYVRAYAELVGLDSQRALADYAAEEQAQGRQGPSEEEITRDIARAVESRDLPRRRIGALPGWLPAGLGAVIVLGTIAGWLWLRPGPDGAAPEPQPRATERPAADTPEPPATDRPALEPPQPRPPETGVRGVPADRPSVPPPAPGPAPSPLGEPAARPASSAPSSLSVTESGVGTDVVNRSLVGPGSRFPAGTVVWFWTRVVGGRNGDEVRHVWLHEERTIATLSFTLGGAHWRVYSRKTLAGDAAGRWSAEVRDATGRILAREEFLCDAVSTEP